MNNTVIEVLDREHGKRVIEFFKSKGVHTNWLEGTLCKADLDPERFYGVIRGVFAAWSAHDLKGVKIITLPEYPKVMEVSDFRDFRESLKRVVFMEKNGRYLAWDGAATLEEAEDSVEANSWRYARDITPRTDIEMGLINARHIVAFWPESNNQTGVTTASDAFIVDMPYQQFKSKLLNQNEE